MTKGTTAKGTKTPADVEKAIATAQSQAFAAAGRAGGAFVGCKQVDHSRAMNNFSNASAMLVILAEHQREIEEEELNAALWGIRGLINHGLELLGQEVPS